MKPEKVKPLPWGVTMTSTNEVRHATGPGQLPAINVEFKVVWWKVVCWYLWQQLWGRV